MKTNELRIGNWVLYSEDSTFFVVGEISTKGLIVENEQETTWIEIEEFEPIPLTEEILLKCGWSRRANTRIEFHCENVCEIFWDSERMGDGIWIEIDCIISSLKNVCKYLHQLQNLYFALTGKELEIKL